MKNNPLLIFYGLFCFPLLVGSLHGQDVIKNQLLLLAQSNFGQEYEWVVKTEHAPGPLHDQAVLTAQKLRDAMLSSLPKAERIEVEKKLLSKPLTYDKYESNFRLTLFSDAIFTAHRTSHDSSSKEFQKLEWYARGDGLCFKTLHQNKLILADKLESNSPLHMIGGLPLCSIKKNLASADFVVIPLNQVMQAKLASLGFDASGEDILLSRTAKQPSTLLGIKLDAKNNRVLQVIDMTGDKLKYSWKASYTGESRLPSSAEQKYYDNNGGLSFTERWELLAVNPAPVKLPNVLPPFPKNYHIRDTSVKPPVVVKVGELLNSQNKPALKTKPAN